MLASVYPSGYFPRQLQAILDCEGSTTRQSIYTNTMSTFQVLPGIDGKAYSFYVKDEGSGYYSANGAEFIAKSHDEIPRFVSAIIARNPIFYGGLSAAIKLNSTVSFNCTFLIRIRCDTGSDYYAAITVNTESAQLFPIPLTAYGRICT